MSSRTETWLVRLAEDEVAGDEEILHGRVVMGFFSIGFSQMKAVRTYIAGQGKAPSPDLISR